MSTMSLVCATQLERDFRVLKQARVSLPADLAGIHYIEYSLSDLEAGRGRSHKDFALGKDS